MQKNGVFVISLDFELHWGCFDTMRVFDDSVEQYFLNTRKAIPEMLSIEELSAALLLLSR